MTEEKRTPCPTCQGKKIIDGVCEVSSEWRGTTDELSDDTQCTPDQTCPTCKGKGYENKVSSVPSKEAPKGCIRGRKNFLFFCFPHMGRYGRPSR